jgi:hypothetical protein
MESGEESMNINARDAVRKAIEAIQEFYPDANDIRLEEIEPRSIEDNDWDVVVSFKVANQTLAHVIGGENRLFKVVRILSGEVHSLKVWKI